jgi:hypothetical protein
MFSTNVMFIQTKWRLAAGGNLPAQLIGCGTKLLNS